MKKSKLNLLTNREDYQKIEKYFAWLRISVIILSVFFLIIIVYFFINLLLQHSQISALTSKKKFLLEQLQDKEEDEAKAIIIQKKYLSIKEYLKDDARPLPYYNLLNTAMASSTESAGLKSFQITKNREVNFTVSFTSFGDLLNFFKFIESDNFLKNFERLSLESFTAISSKESEKSNYELSFVGKFISINENSN